MTTESFADERDAFEKVMWKYYEALKKTGWSSPEEGDSVPEALFWRREDGKYGVNQIEAAWVGWQMRASLL